MSSSHVPLPTYHFENWPKSNFDKSEEMAANIFGSFMTMTLVISIIGIAGTILTKCLFYIFLRHHGLPSINIKAIDQGWAARAELQPLLPDPDSMIKNTTVENFLNEIACERPIRFTPEQLDGYTQRRSAKLGAGGFGAVYKGMLPNGLDIAVKVMDENKGKEITEQQFMAEVGTLWMTNHTNLIRLIGYCFDDGARALVYEFMPKRSVDKYLFDRRNAVDPAALLAIAVGVARGLRYLHEECQKKIIHHDVKASNVLLDDSLTPKLTDFGIAHQFSRTQAPAAMRELRGTPGHMAPEVGTPAPVTEKCDVFSFGMLLFEVIGRRRIMDNDEPESHKYLPLLAWDMYERGELMDLVRERHSVAAKDEEKWKETAERMCKVAFLCVQGQSEARPAMSLVLNMLEGHSDVPPPVFPFRWMYPEETEIVTVQT